MEVEVSLAAISGVLTDRDIIEYINNDDIVICPFEENNLTPIGYNLSFTKFIFSVNNRLLLEIHEDSDTGELYCWVEPNDTILILTKEAVWVSRKISGTFHSKVKIVSSGFGHISTTLDPHWEGPLLISLNNPTRKRIKLVIGKDCEDKIKYSTFVTLIFYRMLSESEKAHDNPTSRIDILKDITEHKELKKLINKIRDFESVQVNIGTYESSEDKKQKIEEFKNKYQRFASEIINASIEEAHQINDRILKRNKKINANINIIFVLLAIILISMTVMAYKKSNSNLLSTIAIINAIYLFVLNKISNIKDIFIKSR